LLIPAIEVYQLPIIETPEAVAAYFDNIGPKQCRGTIEIAAMDVEQGVK